MQNTASSVYSDIILQAAEWHTQLHAEDVSDSDRMAFANWMAVDERHAKAFTQMEKLWTRFDEVKDSSSKQVLSSVLKQSQRKPVKLATKAFLLAVIIVGTIVCNTQPARIMLADYHTGTGEQRTIELADHSQITLDTHSAVNIHFKGGQRRIELLKGKILAKVAKDKQHPFIVETAEGTARALGTQYIVQRQQQVTRVVVVESTVEACNAQASCVTLSAGQSTKLQSGLSVSKSLVDIQNETAWMHFKLVADDMPVAKLLEEMQRYHHGHLYYDATSLAPIHVSGVFALDDTAHTLKVLADTTPVEMTSYTPWLTSIKPAK